MKYSNFFRKELQKLREEGLYRNFREIDRPIKKFPKAFQDWLNKRKIEEALKSIRDKIN